MELIKKHPYVALAALAAFLYWGYYLPYGRYMSLKAAYQATNPVQPSPYTWSLLRPFSY